MTQTEGSRVQRQVIIDVIDVFSLNVACFRGKVAFTAENSIQQAEFKIVFRRENIPFYSGVFATRNCKNVCER